MSEVLDFEAARRKRDFGAVREQVKRGGMDHAVAGFLGMMAALPYGGRRPPPKP